MVRAAVRIGLAVYGGRRRRRVRVCRRDGRGRQRGAQRGEDGGRARGDGGGVGEGELAVALELEVGERARRRDGRRHAQQPVVGEVERGERRQAVGEAARHLGELVAAEPQLLEAREAADRVGERAQQVVRELEPLEARALAEALRQRVQLVADEPELAQPPQPADGRRQRGELVAAEPQLLQLLELAELPRQRREAVALEAERRQAAQLAEVGRQRADAVGAQAEQLERGQRAAHDRVDARQLAPGAPQLAQIGEALLRLQRQHVAHQALGAGAGEVEHQFRVVGCGRVICPRQRAGPESGARARREGAFDHCSRRRFGWSAEELRCRERVDRHCCFTQRF